jgi:hypothetical protein
MSSQLSSSPVAVIGAGPHGLSAVAHLRDAGVSTLAFGTPLGFWREQMPAEMWLRSSPLASHISSPRGGLALSRWAAEHGRELGDILHVRDFIDYGIWYQQHAVPDLDSRIVQRVDLHGSEFELTLEDGERRRVGRVIVAAGLGEFAYVPPLFQGFPDSIVSHTATSGPMESFAGKSVVVVGAGQSALEAAALLHEAGAQVEVIGRTSSIYWLGAWSDLARNGDGPVVPSVRRGARPVWRQRLGLYWRYVPTEVGGRYSGWVGAAPDVVRHFPRGVRAPLTYHCIRPAGAFWLPDRLRSVPITLGRSIVSVSEQDGRAQLRLDDGSERTVDHVLLGTGYKIDVKRYPFLSSEIKDRLRVVEGSPVLGRGLESSVGGLHFVGAPAAESFGPVMRFVIGTAYTAPAVTQGILGRHKPRFRWAF